MTSLDTYRATGSSPEIHEASTDDAIGLDAVYVTAVLLTEMDHLTASAELAQIRDLMAGIKAHGGTTADMRSPEAYAAVLAMEIARPGFVPILERARHVAAIVSRAHHNKLTDTASVPVVTIDATQATTEPVVDTKTDSHIPETLADINPWAEQPTISQQDAVPTITDTSATSNGLPPWQASQMSPPRPSAQLRIELMGIPVAGLVAAISAQDGALQAGLLAALTLIIWVVAVTIAQCSMRSTAPRKAVN